MSRRTVNWAAALTKQPGLILPWFKKFIQYLEAHCTLSARRPSLRLKLFYRSVIRNTLNRPNNAGLTVIELMLAISILGILASIAVPNVLGEMPKFRLSGAAQQLVGDLMSARMLAVKYNRKVKIFFVGDYRYKICQDVDKDESVDDCEGEFRIINIQDNYKGITISSNNNPIFHPRGNASNLATITLTNSSGAKEIKIAITGRIQII
jgi:type IV fimbrial biogenesis protein FimT